jgi:hypothetical protein
MSSKLAISTLIFLAGARFAMADLIEFDWGERRRGLTVDTSTGLEWLDPWITRDRSYDDVASKTDVGEEFEGFRHATTSEILKLMGHFGLAVNETVSTWFAVQDAIDVLMPGGNRRPAGFFDDEDGGKVGVAGVNTGDQATVRDNVSFSIEHNSSAGNWLVRESKLDLGSVTPAFHIADSNRDGVFDQHDLIRALQSDFYLSGRHGASRSTGDWNGDGFFDQLDVVRVLQVGGYEASGNQALTIPEPGTLSVAWSAFLAAMVMFSNRRIRS